MGCGETSHHPPPPPPPPGSVRFAAIGDYGADDSDEHEPDGPTADAPQGGWLQRALAASTACFKVVYFHHPPYSSGNFEVPRMRWPFKGWGADVVLAGHDHLYERFEVDGLPYFV